MAEMTIRRVGVLSLAKIQGLLMLVIGLIIGVIYGLIFMIFGAALTSLMPKDESQAIGAGSSVLIGVIMMIAIPITYGLLGFIGGAIGGLNYNAQLDAKVEIIADCLRRIGGIKNPPDFQVTPAPNQWHYRSRAQWQYDSIRKRLGYFEAGSRRVCDVAECAVLAPELQQTLERLRARMLDGSLPEDAR